MNKPWVVVKDAGLTTERVVYQGDTHDDAWCAMHEQYTEQEQEELHVDILKRLPDGSLTPEY